MSALYIRLSLSDTDLNEKKEESNSVVNQRSLLHDFVKEHPEFSGEEVEEFVDDGYSGTNFERPAFQRMIELVKQRIITTVIVKDFSRFGRDYIEVGDYMERIFPFMGVRFLSVGDAYDSDFHQVGDDKDLEIIMKNIINTYYSRDLSNKITSTIWSRRARGEFVYSERPFGYLTDPKNSGNIVIDPTAGKYVRLMFDLALEGKETGQIADELNKRNIPTCGVYNHENNIAGKSRSCGRSKCEKYFWDAQKVARIISDRVYAGVYVSAKSRVIVPGFKKRRKTTPDEIVTIHNHHAAIVTEEEFDKAQEIFQPKRINYAAPYKRNPLGGKIVCGNCGHIMQYNERKIIDCFYICTLQMKTRKDVGCFKDRVNETPINNLVFRELKKWFLILHSMDTQLKEREQKTWEEIQILGKKIGSAQAKVKSLQSKKVSLYEEYSDGKISKEYFLSVKAQLTDQINVWRNTLNELHGKDAALRKSRNKHQPEFQELIQKVNLFENEIILTRTMTDTFLERVVVYDQYHIEIQWKWNDLIQELGLQPVEQSEKKE